MESSIELHCFEKLAEEFSKAFWLDNQTSQVNQGSAVEKLHQACTEDGLSESQICLARKAAAVSFISNGVSPL